MTKQIVLLNGPPSSGKDTLANYAIKQSSEFKKESMALPLKQANRGLFQLTEAEYEHFDIDPVAKNTKCDRFLGFSWREVNIAMSEQYLKGKFGKRLFGDLLVQRIQACETVEKFIIADSGFVEEALPLIETFGPENVHHIKLERPGFDYSIDSRSYLDLSGYGVEAIVLHNSFDNPEDYAKAGYVLIKSLLDK